MKARETKLSFIMSLLAPNRLTGHAVSAIFHYSTVNSPLIHKLLQSPPAGETVEDI